MRSFSIEVDYFVDDDEIKLTLKILDASGTFQKYCIALNKEKKNRNAMQNPKTV